MTVRFVPFSAAHLLSLDLQVAQAEIAPLLGERGYGDMLARSGFALTGLAATANAVRPEGAILGCAGILPQWKGRAIAWVLMGRAGTGDWVAIVRRMAAMIETAHAAGLRRIEATTRCDFPAGARLLRALDFELEGRAKSYDPDGQDHYLYARVR